MYLLLLQVFCIGQVQTYSGATPRDAGLTPSAHCIHVILTRARCVKIEAEGLETNLNNENLLIHN